MQVRFCDGDGNTVFEQCVADLAGLIEVVKSSMNIHFQHDIYEYDSHILNHYLEGEEWKQEVVVYLKG